MELKQLRSERGTSMVEFVFILPVLLMLVFAVGEFSIAFARWQVITNAAREGAREATLFRANCTVAGVTNDVRTRIRTLLAAADLTVLDSQIQIIGACGPDTTTVTVTIPFDFEFLPAFATSVGPSLDLVGSSVMRNEN